MLENQQSDWPIFLLISISFFKPRPSSQVNLTEKTAFCHGAAFLSVPSNEGLCSDN